jgi:hypothetical protein
MRTLKIKTILRSNTLKIANSKSLIGKEVEINYKGSGKETKLKRLEAFSIS